MIGLPTVETGYGIIYGIHSSDGVIRYVGLTGDPRQRVASHKSQAIHGVKLPIYHWMRKHGLDSIVFVVLEVCLLDDLNDREIFWISQFKPSGKLLNLNEGGKGQRGLRHSDEVRKAASARMKGSWTGEKNPNYGIPLDPAQKEKMAAKKRGKKWSEERRAVQTVYRGEANARSKLTEAIVREMRERFQTGGVTSVALAKEFGIAQSHAHRVVHNEVWKHVA